MLGVYYITVSMIVGELINTWNARVFRNHKLALWSWSGGSYGNNTIMICCPAQGHPESCALGMSLPYNKSWWCCCHNSLPTAVNPNYNMIKLYCIKCIYNKIRSKSPANWATPSTCHHCDITHLFLTTGVVALHIPSWRVWESVRNIIKHAKHYCQLVRKRYL